MEDQEREIQEDDLEGLLMSHRSARDSEGEIFGEYQGIVREELRPARNCKVDKKAYRIKICKNRIVFIR